MIYDAISRIGDNLEDITVSLHKPKKAIYVVVREDGTYRVMNERKFGFNSKYSYWDFWSELLSMNQPVDKRKVIQSNNKYTFFVKDFKKLTNDTIEEYYIAAGLEDAENWIKDWIKKNVFSFDNHKGNELVKFFFYADAEDYRNEGRKYLLDKCIRNVSLYGAVELGTGIGIVENDKKPFLKTKTRKVQNIERMDVETAYRKALFFKMLKSCIRLGKNYVYVTEDGKVCLSSVGERPEISVHGAILFVVHMDSKGNLVFDCEEPIS